MKAFAEIAVLGLVALSLSAQETRIAENPLSPDSGRVVTIKEEMRIKCNGGDYQIKSIQRMDASPGGDLFVQDEQKQLLQFSSEGRFVRSLVPRGQGLGELDKIESFIVAASEVIVFGRPYKFLHFDFSGRKIKEFGGLDGLFSKPAPISKQFLNFENDGYTMVMERFQPGTRGSGWIKMPWKFIRISGDGRETSEIGSFPFPYFAEDGPQQVHLSRWGQFVAAALGNSRYAICDPYEYVITIYDFLNNTSAPAFSRPYTPIPRQKIPEGPSSRGRTLPDRRKYEPDILGLRFLDEKILAITSSFDKGKGVLIDVWNTGGRFLDSFYLTLPNPRIVSAHAATRILFAGGRVYFPTVNDEEKPVIIIGTLQGY